MAAVGRNDRCPCGSGKRYKDCHGAIAAAAPDAQPGVQRMMSDALAAQQHGQLDRAADLYQQVLRTDPSNFDAMHMFGVTRFQQGNSLEAIQAILQALEWTAWKHAPYRHNLGLAVAARFHDQSERARDAGRMRSAQWLKGRTVVSRQQASVAIVLPCYNHERYVRRALQSVFNQSYRRIEIVVIDDGSQDRTAEIARETLAGSPFPYKFSARPNRGATATINEGVALSSSEFVNVLNSDDWFHEERIDAMVRDVATAGAEWGFSKVACVDDEDLLIDPDRNERARVLADLASRIGKRETVGFSFLGGNAAISSGNILFARALYERIGGFRELRYNHDWDFCLRALRCAEPVFCPRETYFYRLHGANTIIDAQQGGGRQEADQILREYIDWAMAEDGDSYPIAPTVRNWGMYFICTLLSSGMAPLLETEMLTALARDALDRNIDMAHAMRAQ